MKKYIVLVICMLYLNGCSTLFDSTMKEYHIKYELAEDIVC